MADKYVMKNEVTGQYWCDTIFPPLCNDIWKAAKFDSASHARSALNALMSNRQNPEHFKAYRIITSEEKAE